ncbi:MAG: ABC transporter substrate-binding protein [Clostridiales Family XIII bacterium]|jgi:peptide/nickel transport system substrate-binding protein|nr:ABC transporter substrate-binding protein [Clostridiales Family XIII bacterium]
MISSRKHAEALAVSPAFKFSKEYVLLAPSGNDLAEKSCMLIQQDWAKVGVNVRVQLMDFAALLSACREGDYDFAWIGSAGAIDPDESA